MSESTATPVVPGTGPSYATDVPADVRFFQRLIGVLVIAAWFAAVSTACWVYRRHVRVKRALAAVEECHRRSDHACAVRAWREVVRLRGDDLDARAGLCLALSPATEAQATIDECGRALERFRSRAPRDHRIEVMYAARAVAFETLGDHRSAAADWLACADAPGAERPLWLTRRATALARLRDTAGAIEAATAAITASTTGTGALEAHRIRLDLLSRAGQPAEAADSLDALLAESPGDAPLRRLRAELRLASGQLAAAGSDFRYLLESNPRDALAMVGLGDVSIAAGKLSDAVKLYRRALRTDRRWIGAKAGLARVLVLRGKAAEALRLLDKLDVSMTDAGTVLRVGTAEAEICFGPQDRRWCKAALRARAQRHLRQFLESAETAGDPRRAVAASMVTKLAELQVEAAPPR